MKGSDEGTKSRKRQRLELINQVTNQNMEQGKYEKISLGKKEQTIASNC